MSNSLREYQSKQLQEMARDAAKKAGGRLTSWVVGVTNAGEHWLDVKYRPRHWRHCPACALPSELQAGAHVGPKGEKVAEIATVKVAL